jgi:hypothetical protein
LEINGHMRQHNLGRMRGRPLVLLPLFLCLALSTASCGITGPPDRACSAELGVRLSPADTTILIGQSFAATISLTTCGGGVSLEDSFTYSSSAPQIASVDPSAGVVTGESVGDAEIQVSGDRYGWLGGFSVQVLAVSPGP